MFESRYVHLLHFIILCLPETRFRAGVALASPLTMAATSLRTRVSSVVAAPPSYCVYITGTGQWPWNAVYECVCVNAWVCAPADDSD